MTGQTSIPPNTVRGHEARRIPGAQVAAPHAPGRAAAGRSWQGVRRHRRAPQRQDLFLAQCRAARLRAGARPESQLLLLEDERLAGLTVADLGWLVEEHARRFPRLHAQGGVTLYLDEVQYVPGWEGLVRRLMDAGGLEVFVTGSSALVQVSGDDATWEREVRALRPAGETYGDARLFLVTLDASPPRRPLRIA